jgi:apolipoprotein D and lipocalin family protein
MNISYLGSHPVVQDLDLQNFMGRWYVISLIPNWIEKGASNSYDDYELNKDGTIDITYHAIKDGVERTIRQKGIIADKSVLSRWKIQFIKPWVPFYKAPYEVIILDNNYEYMAVGYPDNTFGWIMARSTLLDEQKYNQILVELDEKFGYDKNAFEKVIHNN